MKILILFLYISIINTQYVGNASEFIEYLRSTTPANETILKAGLETTKEFLKQYIYYKVASNPPQPDFDDNYFPKLDIDNLFNNIKTKDTNYFDFRTEFLSAIYKLNDFHTQPLFYLLPLSNMIYYGPIKLSARYDNKTNKAKMYANFYLQPELYKYFNNSEHLIKTIQNNLNTSIESINGKDPFNFIQDFTDIKLRSNQGTYVFKQALYYSNNFNIPVTLKELTNFTVIYSNGDNFTTEYLVRVINNEVNNFKFYENKNDNKNFISFLNSHSDEFNSLLSQKNNLNNLFIKNKK